jgi:xylulokinase
MLQPGLTSETLANRERCCGNIKKGFGMGKYLGIDASTQSMTGLVIDCESGRIGLEISLNFDEHFAAAYGIENGVIDLGDGQVHSSPLMWAQALDLLFERLQDACDLSELDAVSGSGQQHGTVYLNDTAPERLASLDPRSALAGQLSDIFSRATAPVWMDTSTTAQCREIEAQIGGRTELIRLTGNTAFERFSGPQIRKFWQQDPHGYAQTDCIALVSSYVASLLAGQLVGIDAGDASGTNLMDIRRRCWSPRALRAAAPELDDKLLPIPPADAFVGAISPYFVARYGLSPSCLVAPFSGDNPSSLIGLGLVKPGRVALSLGTSDTLFACMDEPRSSELGEGAVFASPDGEHFMALICFLNGSLAREAVRDQYGLDWQGFTEWLVKTPPGNGGAQMLPYFSAEIVPHIPRPGVVRHASLEPDDVGANVRAVIEAQALSSRLHSEWMEVPVTSLSVTGGASANTEILKVFANVHGCPVHRFQTTNSAALGAALRARHLHLKACGSPASWPDVVDPFTGAGDSTIAPDPGARAVYDQALEQYRKLEHGHAG